MTHIVTPENSEFRLTISGYALISANMLDALRLLWRAVDSGPNGDPVIWATAAVRTKEAISIAEGAGIRAQSFAERERDLLLANNALEERARASERRAKALEEHIAESAAAYTSTFISMSRRRRQYREVLKAVTAIAAEKLADMQTFDHAAIAHGREYDPVRTADVAATITAAKVLLGEA